MTAVAESSSSVRTPTLAVSHDTSRPRSHALLHAFCQRIPGVLLILLFAMAFVGPAFIPSVYWILVMVLNVFLVTNAVRLGVGLVITAIKTKKYITTDWSRKYVEFTEKQKLPELPLKSDRIKHVIIIPNYKEEFETLCETLDTLANHRDAERNYKVILAMEQGEKGCEEKAEKLINIFGRHFFQINYTVHPSGIAGEARGKSSNVAWAAAEYASKWLVSDEARCELITVMDADTHLTEKYFECMTFKYCTAKPDDQQRMLFAPTLVFDRNANRVPFVVRLADMCWSIGLMSNFQLPVKFPCSVYTVSMVLAQSVGFWDAGPEAIGEDMHMALKCWTHTRMGLRLTPIYVPASCSNVQADTWVGSVYARFQQSKRHLWGSLDYGYATARVITEKCWIHSPMKSLLCLYLLFEIFFQPYFGFYNLTGQFIFPQSMNAIGVAVMQYTTYIRLALVPFAVVVVFAYERYHYLACSYRASVLQAVEARRAAKNISNTDHALEGVPISSEDGFEIVQVSSGYGQSEVAFREWYNILDWIGFPFALFVYYMIPCINALISQLFTNKLDYQVSLKPTTRHANPSTDSMDVAKTTSEETVHDGVTMSDAPSSVTLVGTDLNETKAEASTPSSRNSSPDSSLRATAKKEISTNSLKTKFFGAKSKKTVGHVPRDSGIELEGLEEVVQSPSETSVESKMIAVTSS